MIDQGTKAVIKTLNDIRDELRRIANELEKRNKIERELIDGYVRERGEEAEPGRQVSE